jgi:hypothetical protein
VASNDRIDTTILNVEPGPDNRRTEQSIDEITDRLGEQRAEVKRLSEETRKLERAFRKGADVSGKWAKAEADLVRAKTKQVKVEQDLRRAVDSTNRELEERDMLRREQAGLLGDVESRTRAITGAVGFVGGAGGAQAEQFANIGAELFAVGEAAQLLRGEIPELTKNLLAQGPATTRAVSGLQTLAPGLGQTGAQALVAAGSLTVMLGAMAVIAVTFKVAKDIIDKSAEATKNFVDVNQRYAEIIATGTTVEVEEAIAANKERNKELEIERKKLQGFINQAKDIDGVTGALIDANDALNLNLGGYEDVQNRLEDVDAELGNNIALNDQLTIALRSGATAANDAKEAEERLAAERERQSTKRIDRIRGDLEAEALANRRAETFTRDQLEERKKAVEDSLELEKRFRSEVTDQYRAGEITLDQWRAAMSKNAAEISALEQESELLNSTVEDGVVLRENESAAVEILNKSLKSAEEAELARAAAVEAGAKSLLEDARGIQDRVSAITDIEQDRADKELKQRADFERKQSQKTMDHYRDLAKLDEKFFKSRDDLLADIAEDVADVEKEKVEEIRDANRESIRAAQDHQRELLSIQRDLNTGIESAVEDRNVAAAIAAARQAEEAATVENERFETEQARREEDLEHMLAQLDMERDERLAAGRQALDDLRSQHNAERSQKAQEFSIRMSRETQEFTIRMSRQQQAYQIEEQALDVHNKNMLSLNEAFYSASEQALASKIGSLTAPTVAPTGGEGSFSSALSGVASSILSPFTSALGGGGASNTLNMPISLGTLTSVSDIENAFLNVIGPQLMDAIARASR